MDPDFEPAANTDGRVGTPTSFLVFHSRVTTANLRRTGSRANDNGRSSSQQVGAEKGASKATGWHRTIRSASSSSENRGGSPGHPPVADPPPSHLRRHGDFLSRHPKMARSFRRTLVDSAMLEAYEASAARNCCYEAMFAHQAAAAPAAAE